jgi:hypothetical protein
MDLGQRFLFLWQLLLHFKRAQAKQSKPWLMCKNSDSLQSIEKLSSILACQSQLLRSAKNDKLNY